MSLIVDIFGMAVLEMLAKICSISSEISAARDSLLTNETIGNVGVCL